MFIDTRGIGFGLTDAIRRHVEYRVESALGRLGNRIVKVVVRLEDVNADRGGIDKRCGVVVALRGNRTVVAEATDADLYAAIDKAAARARQGVLRILSRHAQIQRRSLQRPGALV